MNKRNYYPINESAESKAAKYHSSIDHAHAIAERIAEARPWQADCAFRIADRYAQKLTDLLNSNNASGQTTEQNAASEAEFQRLRKKYITRLRKILNEKEVIHSDDENVIEELKEKRKGNTEQTLTCGTHTMTIRENVELMKLQLIFDCKPGSDEQELLRYYHFKWDRANGCWQKTLSDKTRKEFKSAKWNFISLGWEEKRGCKKTTPKQQRLPE